MQGFFQQYLFLHRTLTNELNEVLAEFDLSYSLWQVIFYVEQHGTSQLAAISDHYNIERPSVTRVVQRLEEKGIIEEIPGKDKRGKSIQLTSAGEELYHACREKITELEYRVLGSISQEKLQTAFEIFPEIRDNLIAVKEYEHDEN